MIHKQRKKLWLLLGLLSVVNAWIFLNRDQFQYRHYVNDEDLYHPQSSIHTDPAAIFKPAEQAWARNLSKSVVHDTMATPEKLKALSLFLLSQFHDQRGIPPPHLLQAEARETYAALQQSKTNRVWCGHYAHLLILFAWANGIRGRIIEVINPDDHHVLNEFFIPEWNQWVMNDYYNDVVFARNVQGGYLNVQSFRRQINTIHPVRILKFSNNALVDSVLDKNSEPARTYHKGPSLYQYYNTTRLSDVYTFGNKLKRYLLATPWYFIYQDQPASNFRHHLKLLFLAGWLVVVVLLVLAYFKKNT